MDTEKIGLSEVDYWLAEWLKPTGKRRSEHTAIAYRADVKAFLGRVKPKSFDRVEVADLLDYQSWLADEYGAEKTRARKMASVIHVPCPQNPGGKENAHAEWMTLYDIGMHFGIKRLRRICSMSERLNATAWQRGKV